jgi:beta-phosphoglucomutase
VVNSIKQKYTKELIPKHCPPDYSKIILMRHLKDRGYKLGCCSNSMKETLHLMLHSSGLLPYFDIVIGNDEVTNAKPHPEIYHQAFERLGVGSHECVIIEDSPHGVRAAKESGARVIEVRGVADVNLSLFEELLNSNETL